MKLHSTYPEIWKLLDEEERLKAASAFLARKAPAEFANDFKRDLAAVLKFRPETLSRLPRERLAAHLAWRLKEERLRIYAGAVLVDYLITEHVPMLSLFLDTLGIDHDKGLIDGEADPGPDPPGRDALIEAITAIAAQHPEWAVEAYLSIICIREESDLWDAIPDAVEALRADQPELEPDTEGTETAEIAEEDSPESVEELQESSEDFTTLDNLLIRSAVATATGEIGAMSVDALFDLVEEVSALNADRRRSYFHKGFFDALFDREFTFSFPGENAERRAWYLRGVMLGLLRADRRSDCLEIIEHEAELVNEVAEGRNTPCGAELLPLLYPALMEAEKYQLCRTWVCRQYPCLAVPKKVELLEQIYQDAANLVRSRNTEVAVPLLEILVPRLGNDKDLPEDYVSHYLPRAWRKLAQSHQGQGNFTQAEQQIRQLAEDPEQHLDGAVLADLGLIRAGLRSLSEVVPRITPVSNETLVNALEAQEELFAEAVSKHGERATNAHYVLGVLGTLRSQDDTDNTVAHLQQARAGMLSNQAAYEHGNLITWASACLGLALLESLDHSEYQRACDLTMQALCSKVILPTELSERLLGEAALFDDPVLAIRIAERLLELRGHGAFPMIRASGVLESSEMLREEFMRQQKSSRLPAEEAWSNWESILLGAMKGHSWEQAEDALDQLGCLAHSHTPYRTRFAELLGSRESWAPVWEEEDVENLLEQFHELDGRNAEAAEILQRRFYKRKQEAAPHQLEEAAQLLDQIRSLGCEHIDCSALEGQLEAARTSGEDPDAAADIEFRLAEGANVSLVYIGGNETQAQYEKGIKQRLADDWPGVEVDFHFTGWDASWTHVFNTLRNRIGDLDAVVLNYLVRTNCGKRIRALCDKKTPWFPCTGRGKKSLEGSIRQAARWAVSSRA